VRLPQDHETLSIGDALFLHLEREGMPLNVALVVTLEGVVDLPTLVSYIESKLPLIPRYLQRVITPAIFAGLPMWEYDPGFDIRNHVREIRLRRGSEREFKDAAAGVLSTLMPRERPLWDLTLMQGLAGGRTGLIARAHHCLADGISGVGLLKALMEDAPHQFVPPKRKPKFSIPPQRDPATMLFDTVVHTCFTTVDRVLSMESEFLELARRFAQSGTPTSNGNGAEPEHRAGNGVSASFDELRRALPDLLSPAERLPFNTVCHGPQKFEWTEIPLDEIRDLKKIAGATTNDVILTLLTLAVQRYARMHGVSVRKRRLRVVVPVSVRGKDHAADLGNRITFVPVSLPLNIARPARLLAAVHERTSLLKTAHIAEAVATAGGVLATVPTGVQALLGPIASQLPLSVCNLICTNVPGPRSALYLMGHELLSCYPYVPIGGEMGMNCAVITYNGMTYFGFTGDAGAIPDLHVVPKLLQRSFREFRKQAGKSARHRAMHADAAQPAPTASDAANVVAMSRSATGKLASTPEPEKVLHAVAGD
jgi:diacylglycerol O-acyltransferase / wax synthase